MRIPFQAALRVQISVKMCSVVMTQNVGSYLTVQLVLAGQDALVITDQVVNQLHKVNSGSVLMFSYLLIYLIFFVFLQT